MVDGPGAGTGRVSPDEALAPGSYAIVPDDGPLFVLPSRSALLAVLACDFLGRSDYTVRRRAADGSPDQRRAGAIEPGWGIEPAAPLPEG